MGNSASFTNNGALVDALVDRGSINFPAVEFAFRVIDRGTFFPQEDQKDAYADRAFRSETDEKFFHISAPDIYSSVLEHFDLQKGMSFLNIGSGTGYFSSLVGIFLGHGGVNHGVECHPYTYEWQCDIKMKLLESSLISCFDWCEPKYFHGNCFNMKTNMKYDRIYCGAKVPQDERMRFVKMLKIGGVCIMPYGRSLQRIQRSSEKTFLSYDICEVEFGDMVVPGTPTNLIELPNDDRPKSLYYLTRSAIFAEMRNAVGSSSRISIRQRTTQENAPQRPYPYDVSEDEMLTDLNPAEMPQEERQNGTRVIPERDSAGYTIYSLRRDRPPNTFAFANIDRFTSDEEDDDRNGVANGDRIAAGDIAENRIVFNLPDNITIRIETANNPQPDDDVDRNDEPIAGPSDAAQTVHRVGRPILNRRRIRPAARPPQFHVNGNHINFLDHMHEVYLRHGAADDEEDAFPRHARRHVHNHRLRTAAGTANRDNVMSSSSDSSAASSDENTRSTSSSNSSRHGRKRRAHDRISEEPRRKPTFTEAPPIFQRPYVRCIATANNDENSFADEESLSLLQFHQQFRERLETLPIPQKLIPELVYVGHRL